MTQVPQIPIQAVIDCIYAAHLSSYVATPIEDRGGIFFIGPPGVLKSSLLGVLDRRYPDALTLADMNVQMWVKHLREQFSNGEYRTLVLPELKKIYERHSATSSNLEGVLRALVAEGFRFASFEDPNATRKRARAVLLGAMTPKLYADMLQSWRETGFSRRFLFALYSLADPKTLDRALDDGRRVEIGIGQAPPEPQGPLADLTTVEERRKLTLMLKYQPRPNVLQKLLLIRMLSVLKWWYPSVGRKNGEAWETIEQFAQLLGSEGAELVIEEPKPIKPAKKGRRK